MPEAERTPVPPNLIARLTTAARYAITGVTPDSWVGDDAVDPLQQAQTFSILVTAGIKTREEARSELGLAPEPGAEVWRVREVQSVSRLAQRAVHDGGRRRRRRATAA